MGRPAQLLALPAPAPAPSPSAGGAGPAQSLTRITPPSTPLPSPVRPRCQASASPYKFVTFGDFGTGTALQRENAAAINAHCAASADACSKLLMLGDIFYDGPFTTSDKRWTTELSAMYTAQAPFYAMMGSEWVWWHRSRGSGWPQRAPRRAHLTLRGASRSAPTAPPRHPARPRL